MCALCPPLCVQPHILPQDLNLPGSFLGPWCGHKCSGWKSLAMPQKHQQSDSCGAELYAVPALGPGACEILGSPFQSGVSVSHSSWVS